jgi:hypothetical protein
MIFRFSLLIVTAFCCSSVSAARWAENMFDTRSHDFGTVAKDAKVEYEFVLSNKYLEDVRVASARVSCSCISVKVKNPELKTYEKGAIVAKLNTKSFRGQRHVTITVTFDKPFRATAQLQVKGYIRSDVAIEPSGVDFGQVDLGTTVDKTIRVSRIGQANWRIQEVRSTNPNLSAEVVRVVRTGSRVTCDLRVRLDKDAPVGYLRDHLMLVTNDYQRSQIPVQVDGRVLPSLVVSPSSWFLGRLKPGQAVTRPLVVQSKKPFRVLSVASEHDAVAARLPEDSAAKSIHVIPITFTAGDQPGKVLEVIKIKTDLDGEPTVVTAHAVVRS